jgi:hypothetical protein
MSRLWLTLSKALAKSNMRISVCWPSKIMKHGEENNILYPLQHGFRKGHSCETQLIEFVDDISKNLQEGQQTDILILICYQVLVPCMDLTALVIL